MNRLRRMILVNSAKVSYREVLLDGHIHFIGTQGTGKSTLLRGLLFFYNADQRKLGISKDKKSFAEYYFPYADSYIFYEVQAGERHFCVWLYKRQNRLCFRFIDGGYDQSMAIHSNQARSESEVMARAAELGFKVERAIHSFTEYRDILYGENRSMRRYALMRNATNYSTIPRTISNIFLNANLDGNYIKKTIIDSLNEESVEINLEANRHHLETARSNYDDVARYQQHERKAEQIVEYHDDVLKLEEHQRKVAWEIGATFNRAKETVRVLEERCAEEAQAKQNQENKIETLREQFQTDNRRLGDSLAGFKKDISYANKQKRYYEKQDITILQKEAMQVPQLEQDLNHRTERLRGLTVKASQNEQQFEIVSERLKNECNAYIQQLRVGLSDFKDETREHLDMNRNQFDEQKATSEAEHEKNCSGYLSEKTKVNDELSKLDLDLRDLDKRLFFESERADLAQQKSDLEQQRIRTQEEQKQIKAAVEALQREVDDRRKIAQAEGENLLRPLKNENQQLQKFMVRCKDELEALKGSLLEYLDEHLPTWNKTIGRVVRRDVLLESGLEPKIGSGNSLYGVELKLKDQEEISLSKNGLTLLIESTEKQMVELSKKIEDQLSKNRAQQDLLTQRYNRKIRSQREQGELVGVKLFQFDRDLGRNDMTRQELNEREKTERARQQNTLEEQRHKVLIKRQELEDLISDLTTEKNTLLEQLTYDFSRRKKSLEKKIALCTKETEAGIAKQRQMLNERLEQNQADRKALLETMGVDASKVSIWEGQIARLREKLDAIKKHERTLIEYEKDKRDWIDKLEDFKRERAQLENKLKHRAKLFDRRNRQEQELLVEIRTCLAQLQGEQERVDSEISSFKQFEKEELFSDFESFIRHHDYAKEFTSRDRIDELKNLAWKFEKDNKRLNERITAFSGLFEEKNCLGFEVHLTNEASFRAFAKEITEFVREQKIVTLKTEVTRKYSMVLESIVNETNLILKREGDVQRIVQKINSDFKDSNFVGVVRSIEMRLQESSNRVFQALRELCRFQAEHFMSFGELDLFNRGNSKNDEKAVELLDRLRLQMEQTNNTRLKLEDALELEFRVCENENDTNWVNRLANVGSNGTDVLVKSMIYINLLNIFKTSGRKQVESAMLHCLVDEVGILHDSNVTSLINFAAERGICMINGSPNSHNEQDYKHIYIFRKDNDNRTAITKLISHGS